MLSRKYTSSSDGSWLEALAIILFNVRCRSRFHHKNRCKLDNNVFKMISYSTALMKLIRRDAFNFHRSDHTLLKTAENKDFNMNVMSTNYLIISNSVLLLLFVYVVVGDLQSQTVTVAE